MRVVEIGEVQLKDLKFGDDFRYNNEYYKLPYQDRGKGDFEVINLEDGTRKILDATALVVPVALIAIRRDNIKDFKLNDIKKDEAEKDSGESLSEVGDNKNHEEDDMTYQDIVNRYPIDKKFSEEKRLLLAYLRKSAFLGRFAKTKEIEQDSNMKSYSGYYFNLFGSKSNLDDKIFHALKGDVEKEYKKMLRIYCEVNCEFEYGGHGCSEKPNKCFLNEIRSA